MYTPLQLAQAFISTGEIDDALAALDEHLTAEPADDEARRWRAEVLARFATPAHWQKALDDLNALGALTPADALRQSALHERLNDPDAALHAIATARQRHPTDERLLERHIGLLRGRGEPAQALALLDALADLPDDWRWAQWRGDLLADARAHPEAVAAYTQALDKVAAHTATMEPHWAEGIRARLLAARAHSREQLADYPAADDDYQTAQALVPGDPLIAFNRGRVACYLGDDDRARDLIRDAYQRASAPHRATIRDEIAHDARLHRLGLALDG